MAPRASERVMNLAMYLLAAPGPRLHSDIREGIELYHGLSERSFLRAFERDKHLLRQLGVPLRTVEVPGSESGVGYVIDADDFELPPVEFAPGEAMLIELAARTWQEASVATEAAGGLMKLQAAGEWGHRRPEAFVPRMAARESGFDLVWDALLTERRLRFRYRDTERLVHPWRLVSRHGSSYLVGLDETRQAPRVFKLARITDGPEAVGEPGSALPPDGSDVDAAVARLLDPDPPEQEARLAVRRGRQGMLTRRGRPDHEPAETPDGYEPWIVPFGSVDRFVQDIAAAGADVIVLEPEELRVAVIAHLRGVA